MAGVSTKEIKNRIRSMESTKQITKAMEMVAASKLRRAQAQVSNSRPYFEILYNTIQDLIGITKDLASPYLKLVMNEIQGKDATVLPIGKKSVDYFRSKGIPSLTDTYAEAADVSIGDCFSIANQLSKAFLSGEYDEIHIAFTNFVSVLSQVPATMQLLPLKKPEAKAPSEGKRRCDTIYEHEPEEVFAAIVPEYLGGVLYGCICESRAAEQAARRSAMDSATQNADEMIADLSLKFNRARQAAITQEITEIVAGS